MPKIQMPGQNRAEWYDRSPLNILESANRQGTPQALGTRWTYTVPVNRAFMLGGGYVWIRKDTVSGTPDMFRAVITLNSEVYGTGGLAFVASEANVIDASKQMMLGGGVIFEAGEILRGITVDLSADGKSEYHVVMYGTEFDV